MNNIKYDNFFNKNTIIDMYNNGMSGIEIANSLNTKSQYVYRFMIFHNIKRRTKADALKNAYKKNIRLPITTRRTTNNKLIKKDDILKYYYKQNLKKSEVAKKLDIAGCYLDVLFKKFNIKKKSREYKNNPHWQGGVIFDGKRKLIYCKEHPNPDFLGRYVYEYRLIIEKNLGRLLKKKEIVHHINNDVTDNRIENLEVMSQGEHCKKHFKIDREPIKCKWCLLLFKPKNKYQTFCSHLCVSRYANYKRHKK